MVNQLNLQKTIVFNNLPNLSKQYKQHNVCMHIFLSNWDRF